MLYVFSLPTKETRYARTPNQLHEVKYDGVISSLSRRFSTNREGNVQKQN
jgi:hypothetical protein